MTLTLEDLHGRVGDVDSHEHIPVARYPEIFGERAERFVESIEGLTDMMKMAGADDPMNLMADRMEAEEITPTNVWELKGSFAPSSMNMDRRPAVLEMMGITRSLIFPGLGLVALAMAHGGNYVGFPSASEEGMKLAEDAIDAYNEWAGSFTQKYPEQLRIVGVLPSGRPGITVEELVKKAEKLVATGVKAVQISSGLPPAGLSPADPAMDAFYKVLTDADCALVFHPPSGAGFRASDVWGHVPGYFFDVTAVATVLHAAEETFVNVLVLGGVFERHPDLRVGCIESGASWLGPLAERMDWLMATKQLGETPLTMRPSEYLARHVRVSGLGAFDEPIDKYVERFPALEDCYCYSSDFPHVEGMPYSMEIFYKKVAPMGDAFIEKFFCTNSQLVLR